MLEALGTFTLGEPWDLFPTELGSSLKDSYIYETYAGALSNPGGGSGVFDVYRAERTDQGWSSGERVSPSPTGLTGPTQWSIPGGASADHLYSFSYKNETGFDYLRNTDGSFELVGMGSIGTEPYAQGRYISVNGAHVLFTTGNQKLQSLWCGSLCKVSRLEPNSPPEGTGAVYDRSADGPTHMVSLLPSGLPPAEGEQAFYKGASQDAESVAFEINGTLYVRVDNGLPGAGTEQVANGEPVFAGLSREGRYLFYVKSGTIHRFDTTDEADIEVNPVGEGLVVNVSADGSHVYFVSEQLLDGGKGTPGQPNMYSWSSGSPRFVATVLPGDLTATNPGINSEPPGLGKWTASVTPSSGFVSGPGMDSSRSTPDGSVLIFESRAELTPFANSGHTEIYRWDDSAEELICVSCMPVGQAATSNARLQELRLVPAPIVLHNLSDDGSRVFFETSDPLVERDTNSANDIYEWHVEEGGPTLHLISTGESPSYSMLDESEVAFAPLPNLLMSISRDGRNVFFMAKEALVPEAGDNGTQAIYDARVDGGFPPPPTPISCSEEGCRGAAGGGTVPLGATASEAITGSGNVRPKHHCRHRSKKSGGRKDRHCPTRHAKTPHKRVAAKSGSAQSRRGEGEVDAGSFAVSTSQSSPPFEEGRTPSASTAAAGPVSAGTAESAFGIQKVEGRLTTAAAGMHPDFTTVLEFNHTEQGGLEDASQAAEEITFKLPPGLLGNPDATPQCSIGDFTAFGKCSPDSQVGITRIKTGSPLNTTALEPIYNLTPPHPDREVARFGLIGFLYPIFIDVKVRTAGDYGVTAVVQDPPGLGAVIRATTTFWADPASTIHDEERLTVTEVEKCSTPATCKVPPPGRPSGIKDPKAFFTNPSSCQDQQVAVEVKSYQTPGQRFSASAPLNSITDCSGLPFSPSFEAEPTSHVAGAATGLKTKLVIPQHLGVAERATATMREARVTLPEGMQVAAGAANWIGTCSEEQVGYHEEVVANCPDNSKLGAATIVSPALSVPIEGTIYQRSPQPGHQLGLWLTSDALGMHIKLPGELEPDKQTGRLTAVFSDLPQVPVEEIDLNVWGGRRAPLQNPDHCGTFETDFAFSPHSNDPIATGRAEMQITEGCNQPFSPTLHAGVTEPTAGKFSPFVFDLTRADGDQALQGFTLTLPEGELAKIKGVPLCADADAAAASCPPGSRIGSLQATTGPGPNPFTLPAPGKAQPQLYLSGPYQGAPFSIVSEAPAQAGPFDLGTLTVRSGLEVNPETGQASVKADPLPQFFEGVGITYRNLHAVVDRPEFNLNPTDCSEMQVSADATSSQGEVANPSARFQIDGCKALKFKPKLSLKLQGGSQRAAYPALTAVLKARKGDANVARASVALPHSEFLAQEHIGTICTRVQFAADKCPKGSVYGKAKAITPLLAKPLSGPVYLRSSNHPLPDLVAKLGGELEIDLIGRIDSIHGGIRTTFESVPDAPVTKFVLQMRGGAKGLLTNSTDICRGAHKATVRMLAQNGRVADLRPRLVSSACGKKKLGKHKKHH